MDSIGRIWMRYWGTCLQDPQDPQGPQDLQDLVANLVHPADDLVVHPAETTPDSIEALGRGVTTKTPRRELPAMKHIG